MKKLIYCALALAAGLFASSCQQENLEPVQEGNTVTFTVEIPEVATKATIGDEASSINDLVYAVYRTTAPDLRTTLTNWDEYTNLVYQKNPSTQVFTDHFSTTVSLELINNQNYVILFWAQKNDVWVAGENFDLTKITYPADGEGNVNMVVNRDDADKYAAFSAVRFLGANEFAGQKTVELKRPFAQINIAAKDPVNYDVVVNSSSMTVGSAGDMFNVASQVAAATKNITYKWENIPATDGYVAGGVTYDHYVAMGYVFAKDNVTVSYDINTAAHGTVTNTINHVPVAANYRTNIVGGLLTSNVDYNVTLDKEWGTPDTEEYVWNGTEILQPSYNAETKTYTIKNAAELAWVANEVNVNSKNFKGEIVQLVADIDLGNYSWTPIGYGGKHFQGTFEGIVLTKAGNSYPTISNLFIENGEYAGLFGTISDGGLLRNFNLNHVRISGSDYLGAVLGRIYTTVDNVTVTDAEITAVPYLLSDGVTYDGGAKVGGIAGLVDQSATITNCTVKNSTFRAYRDMGGIVGTTQYDYPTTLTGNSVENLTFIVTEFYTPYNGNDKPGHYAPIRGGKRSNAGDVIDNNTGDEIGLHKVLVEANEGAVYDSEEKVYIVTSPAGLAAALQASGAADAGSNTIQINGDLDMTGMEWTPIYVDGYNGADIVTVEGNGATIKGLDGALFAGGFAGGSGIVIKNLTIEDAHMTADNTLGYGAFVNCTDSMVEITLINCHLKNSTIITPNDGAAESRIGGLVGWTAGYDKQNDGPVDSNITIQNCSVTGCTLKGAGSIGGICGHAGANAATFTTIENCTVTGNTLVSTDDGGWRVGAIVGTANNGQCVINNVTASGNTISQVDKTAEVYQSELYGRFVPDGTGTLTINGTAVSTTTPVLVNGYTALYSIDGNYYVYNKQGLEDLNNFFTTNAWANHLWTRSYNIGADIDANGFTWNSVYVVVGNNASDGFVLNGCGHTISNLSINGSMFTGTPNGGNEGTKPGYVKDITIYNATVTGYDSSLPASHWTAVFWGNSYGELVYENVTVKNTSVTGYCNTAIFLGGTVVEGAGCIDNILFKNCKVENCSVVAYGKDGQDPTGASVFCGRAFGKTKLTFEGTNTIDEATTITNNNDLVGGRVYGYTTWYGDGFTGTGACDTFTDFAGVEVVKVGDNVYGSFAAAVANANAGDTIALLSDVTLAEETEIPAGVTLKGNGNQINGSIYAGGDLTFEGHTKVTSFSASYYNRTITIGEGACLEVTGTGRVTVSYGNKFNITGSITDAKNADKSAITPSLVVPNGLSFNGNGGNAEFNVTNAYIVLGNTTSKNSGAEGIFNFNFYNSVAEFTNQLLFAIPTNGKTPTFNVNLENSVLTTATKLGLGAPNTTIKLNNSLVNIGTYLRNSGKLELVSGSILNSGSMNFGEHGGHNGITIVDASKFNISTSDNKAYALDGQSEGKIILRNNAEAYVQYYKALTIENDGTCTFTGTKVQ